MRKIVLFLCTGNSARSQMAEGLLREMGGPDFEVHSAGMHPAEAVNPLAVQVMDEIGIDISDQQPKGVETYLGKEFLTYLIIVCNKARGTCPRVWPGLMDENRLFWPFDDPAEVTGETPERLEVFRRVRDEIKAKLSEWIPTVS